MFDKHCLIIFFIVSFVPQYSHSISRMDKVLATPPATPLFVQTINVCGIFFRKVWSDFLLYIFENQPFLMHIFLKIVVLLYKFLFWLFVST